MLNCPRRTIGWSSCPVIRSQRRICCSCFDSCRSNFLLNRRRKSKPGTIAKSRERSPPVVPTFGAVSQGFQYLGVTKGRCNLIIAVTGGHQDQGSNNDSDNNYRTGYVVRMSFGNAAEVPKQQQDNNQSEGN